MNYKDSIPNSLKLTHGSDKPLTSKSSIWAMDRQYLVVLAQEHINFRIPEVESICGLFGKNLNEVWNKKFLFVENNFNGDDYSDKTLADAKKNHNSNHFTEHNTPYIVLHNVDEQDIVNILSRTLFVKSAYEIWGHGCKYHDLKKSILEYPETVKQPCFTQSFCIRVKAFGKKVSLSEQVEKIDGLEDILPFQSKVDLHSPENEFHLIEDYGMHAGTKFKGDPHYVYFGRLIGQGRRSLIESYSIKNRKFIGNTSMDAALSFVMSNVAAIKPGHYVCDPFVGTGSLLIAAAHHGAFVTGGDINYNILHARGKSSRVGAGFRQKDETFKNSLKQYGLQNNYVDMMVCDASRHPWTCSNKVGGIFDAIITDPPYGIREKCRKVGKNKETEPNYTEYEKHYPEQTAYHLDQVFTDLLIFSSQSLVPGGRLVYWLPIYKPEYTEEGIPKHPNLTLIYNCEQPLKRETSRRMIVMEKNYNAVRSNGSVEPGFSNSMYQGHNAFRNKYFNVDSERT